MMNWLGGPKFDFWWNNFSLGFTYLTTELHITKGPFSLGIEGLTPKKNTNKCHR